MHLLCIEGQVENFECTMFGGTQLLPSTLNVIHAKRDQANVVSQIAQLIYIDIYFRLMTNTFLVMVVCFM